jgi:hypothetical protein
VRASGWPTSPAGEAPASIERAEPSEIDSCVRGLRPYSAAANLSCGFRIRSGQNRVQLGTMQGIPVGQLVLRCSDGCSRTIAIPPLPVGVSLPRRHVRILASVFLAAGVSRRHQSPPAQDGSWVYVYRVPASNQGGPELGDHVIALKLGADNTLQRVLVTHVCGNGKEKTVVRIDWLAERPVRRCPAA